VYPESGYIKSDTFFEKNFLKNLTSEQNFSENLFMKKLTPRQKDILEFLRSRHAKDGYFPSIREIQCHFQFKSTNGVSGHLNALERKGIIEKISGTARAYRIATKKGKKGKIETENFPKVSPSPTESDTPTIEFVRDEDMIEIPFFEWNIAAGYPDNVESCRVVDKLRIDPKFANVRRMNGVFALRVRGESMVNAGIFDGDTVILEQNENPRDGDIVAALIDGETTLKRYVKKFNEPPFLRAENPAFPDLFPIADLRIQGIARSIIRSI